MLEIAHPNTELVGVLIFYLAVFDLDRIDANHFAWPFLNVQLGDLLVCGRCAGCAFLTLQT